MIPNVEQAVELLRRFKIDEKIIAHSKRVAELASEFAEKAERNGVIVDMEVLIVGAILHDIGRSKTHGIDHGFVGARILRDEDIDERVCRVAERHVGAGLEESQGFPYDLFPESVEEKLVCWADKLTGEDRQLTRDEALAELEKSIGFEHPGYQRLVELADEMEGLLS